MRGDELLGFTYIHNHVKIAGYQVYKHYSWKKLQSEYKLIYKPSRDIDVLQQAKTKAFSRINNTNVSKEQYSTNDKPTSSSTSNSSGDTDRNSNLPISTNLLTSNYSDEGLIVEPKLEDKVTAATGGTKRKVQFSQQEQRSRQSLPPQEESEIELSLPNGQNTPPPVESEVEGQLPPPQEEELRQPIQVVLIEVEEELSLEKEESSAQRRDSTELVNHDSSSTFPTDKYAITEGRALPITKGGSFRNIANFVYENYRITSELQPPEEKPLVPAPQEEKQPPTFIEDEILGYPPMQSSQAQLKEQHSQESPPEETFLPTTEQLPSEQSPSEETLLPSHLCHLPSTITDYMLVTNRLRINGRELSASLDENVLSVCRHGDNTPVMQTQYSEGKWYEVQPTRLTANEIEQIESLRTFTQQALINKSQSKGGIEQ